MTWSVVELAGKPAGYADHKPPYDFKHGWKPVSGAAAKAVASERKPGPPDEEELAAMTPRERTMLAGPLPMDGPGPDGHARYLRRLQAWRDKRADSVAEPPSTPESVKAVREPRAKVAPGSGLSPVQQKALDDPESFDQDELTPEWASVTNKPRLTKRETEATHLWQNGYTTALSEDEDSEGVAAGDVGLYKILNAQLRGSGEYDGLDLDEDEWAQIEQMRTGLASALTKSRTTRDVTVFRGVSNLGGVAAGDMIRDPGWQATSMNPALATTFMSGDIVGAKRRSTARLLVVSVPKGTNALAVREKPEHEKYFGIKHEIVLGPDTPLRVTKIEGDRVYAEVV